MTRTTQPQPEEEVYNEYAGMLPPTFYATIPKSVLAAITISYMHRLGVRFDDAGVEMLAEWEILYQNQIVPNKPPKRTNFFG